MASLEPLARVPAVITDAERIAKAMTANPSFPSPTPPPATAT
jgi:hypothetical protein